MIIVPPVTSQASPSTLELGGKIVTLIREYQTNRPDVSAAEIRHALRLAEQSTAGSDVRRVVVMLTAALVAAGALSLLLLRHSGPAHRPTSLYMPLMVGVLVVIVAVAALAAKR